MISLAHAFNYAGSESILTSLWEIDEQSSTRIVASFYEYIDKGFSKYEALRSAKLDYIYSSPWTDNIAGILGRAGSNRQYSTN